MGLDSERTERLVVIAAVMITTALSLPAYAKLSAGISARGVELSWFQHVALFILAVLLGLVGLVLCGLVLAAIAWGFDGASRLLRAVQSRRR